MINIIKNPWLDVYKSDLVRGAYFSYYYEFPLLEKSNYIPKKLIPFDKAKKTLDKHQWVHFYIHDYRFQCIWNNPKQYLNILQQYEGVIIPDFSLYRDLPLAMQIWNTYRNRAIGYWLQSQGIKIIPNIRWGDERTYEFAFEGLEKGGTVAISTYGCIKNKTDRTFFQNGLEKMVQLLAPDTIVVYSYSPDKIFLPYKQAGINIVAFDNYVDMLRKAMN